MAETKLEIAVSAGLRVAEAAVLDRQIQSVQVAKDRGRLPADIADQALTVLRERRDEIGDVTASTTELPVTPEDIAQQQADAEEAAAQLERARAAALEALRARRDRFLAQTDVFALDEAVFPLDMPQTTRDAIVKHRQAWMTFRQELRDYMGLFDGDDPADPLDPPPFPDQPNEPRVRLT